jgi:NADH-quinone oxidoreductase subunit N
VSASDFLVILIAIELISVSSFVLTGFLREDRRSSEAAVKYFMVGRDGGGEAQVTQGRQYQAIYLLPLHP